MATRVYSSKASKSKEDQGPHSHPKPKSETGGRSLGGIMGATPSKGREKGRREMAGAGYPTPTPKPKRHVHASSTTPSRSSPPPKKGRQSGMYSSKASGGRGSAGKEVATRKKKAAQVKRSKAWLKRYGGTDRNDR